MGAQGTELRSKARDLERNGSCSDAVEALIQARKLNEWDQPEYQPVVEELWIASLYDRAGDAGERDEGVEIAMTTAVTNPADIDEDALLRYLDPMMEKYPQDARFPYILGISAMRRGRNEEALQQLFKAIDIDKRGTRWWLYTGHYLCRDCCQLLGRYEEAVSHYDRTARIGASIPG